MAYFTKFWIGTTAALTLTGGFALTSLAAGAGGGDTP